MLCWPASRPTTLVWDVGANVGYYTERFSRLASHVIAFEPVAENCSQINSKMLPKVECFQTALGEATGEAEMFVNGPFSSIALASQHGVPPRTVKIVRGDDLTSLRPPSVVKIDVEGYELEVIRGMQRTLRGVRALFVEVHFQILEQRGMPQGPSQLVKQIRDLGFSNLKWPDASHIAAFRPHNE